MRTPRINHFRHREGDRVRHSTRLLEWVQAQMARLSMTADQIFGLLRTNSAKTVEQMEPTEPTDTP